MEEENYLKKQRIYKTIMLVALTAFITVILTTAYLSSKYDLGGTSSITSLITGESESDDLITQLQIVENLIDKYYLYDVDEQAAIDGAISGYINSLGDAYTEYIPVSEMEEYTEQITGNYVGIGIYMVKNTEKNTIDVLAPIKESPAEKAGILSGDSIIKVDGVEYTADDMTAAANNIKGEEGTTVTLEILRGEETLTFEIVRETINTNPVVSETITEDSSVEIDGNIGYLEISSFDEGTAEDFKTKYEQLKEQGITSLIIDLRNNGGGLVNEALQIIEYIVPKGSTMLITVDKNGNEETEISEEDPIIDVPIVVLVNENTASASEILAGALKDLDVATIVGTQTYGKGVIQQILSLKSGAGLKVTIEEYYTPSKTKIHEVGIEPDEIVELPETVTNPLLVTREEDTQLDKAIEILKIV